MRTKLLQTALRATEQLAKREAIKSAPIQQLTHNLTNTPFTHPTNHLIIPNVMPVEIPNFIHATPDADSLAKFARELMEREKGEKTFKRDFEKYKEEMQKERKPYQTNNSVELSNDQKANQPKVDPANDPKQENNEPSSAKKFTSAKAIQDEVFKEAKEHIEDYRLLLMLFNVSEGTLKKTSIPLFEGIYAAFADKDGIPEDKAKAVVELAKWVVLAIIAFVLYEYVNKKLNEVKNLDAQAVANYAQAEALYHKSILLAQECVRQLTSINELSKNKDLNESLLKLLGECANSEENETVIGAGINNLRAVVDSLVNNKPLERSQLDGKIERKLQSLEEHNPLASMLLEKKGAKGYKGTENALQYQIDKFDNIIKHKKEGLELKQREIRLKTDRIGELEKDTQKIEKIIGNNLLVEIGLFSPVHPNAIRKCNECKDELHSIKADKEDDNVENNNLRLSAD
ncbi:hypothetical protein B0B39_17095 [Legionella longbeachae]|nr:hypothetical protein B0B39_17095 [Legionella longbeachae]EEZ95441.1 hypothetical protein LLB_0615 [Legionella longbeachae D-4968]QEY51067.1 hypothetical protein FQU71_07270 [Legionella longbeachae]QIN31847.1 hypothetical protein GCB94_06635 [Legionella longbeachae]HBD7396795.1 hypothetical protein [Legionella pneumophila]